MAMIFADESDAISFARENNLKISEGRYIDCGYEVEFEEEIRVNSRAIYDCKRNWEEQQPYWGVFTIISNGSYMYKRDVEAVAKRYGIPKSRVQDTTFNVYEAQLMSKKKAEDLAFYLTRNGRYYWQPIRLKR